MTSEPLVDALNRELRAASPDLVGNGDLLRSVLAGCGDCIKVLDLDGRLQFMSEGGKRVMEVDDFSALKGCPWPDFWPGEGNEQAAAAVNSAKAGKTARFRGPANTAKATRDIGTFRYRPFLAPTVSRRNYCRSRAISPKNGTRSNGKRRTPSANVFSRKSCSIASKILIRWFFQLPGRLFAASRTRPNSRHTALGSWRSRALMMR